MEKTQSTEKSGLTPSEWFKGLLAAATLYGFGIGLFILFAIVVIAVLKWAFGIVF